jgi:type III pantothenate kinase
VENAIKAGIYFGTTGSIIHIIRKVRKAYEDLQYIIATGGDAKTFKKDISEIDKVIPRLTLEGIRIAFTESFNP